MNLQSILGKQVLGVVAYYCGEKITVNICAIYPNSDNSLRVFFHNGHQLAVDDFATVHLDNRTGVDEFDANISVYRSSYKGRVIAIDGDWVVLAPRECQLLHGFKKVIDIKETGYRYPDDPRADTPVPFTTLTSLPPLEIKDHHNKVGVLITHAQEQPHTTVLAFLSSSDNDIFLITFPETFKSKVLKKDNRCLFAMDERANYIFENAIHWNYTTFEGRAFLIPNGSPLFLQVREAFIEKNPWEMAFFLREDLEMYHIKSDHLVCSGESA
ncbi:hypothetical protein [Kosakonia oryzae]|uniref:hypothetical protein n=1 Tax=Kosakonia oryzae TaxID=497725 RepID=UPI001D06155A|nr:hypothetical protein [Kosakonia oryzae]UDJ83354.1 hypothetical protein I5186_04430 [Kosakonia oryzae]